jgi:hypothetical protein
VLEGGVLALLSCVSRYLAVVCCWVVMVCRARDVPPNIMCVYWWGG